MENPLKTQKDEKVEALVDDAKDSASVGYDTENQLSNNLISVTLAFVALLATAISTSNVLPSINTGQKVIILLAIIFFCLSIFTGLINYFLNMHFHQQVARFDRRKAQRADDSDNAAELKKVERTTVTRQFLRPTRRNNALIITQISLIIAGLVLCVTFIGSMLFIPY